MPLCCSKGDLWTH